MPTAREIILSEAFGGEGLVSMARFGEDPGAERIDQVCRALKEFYLLSRASSALEREMAHALFCLAYHCAEEHRQWLSRGTRHRDELYSEDLPRLARAVESVLEGRWPMEERQ